MQWYELYADKLKNNGQDYVNNKIKAKTKFINLIKKYAKDGKILEAGCGTGIVSSYLAQTNDTSAVELDKEMVKLAKYASKEFFGGKNKITQGTILDLKFDNDTFEVSFSNGVLEHFEDADIIKIINEQLRVSKYMIFGIPSCYYEPEEASFGNERFLNKKHWLGLIDQSNGVLVESMNFSDEKPFSRLLKPKKWFRPSPFFIFVLKRK